MYVSFFDQIGEKLKEKSNQQQADMHTVHIGIGSHNYFVVAQIIYTVFDIQRRLKQVKLFVFVHNFLRQSVAIERFSAQAKHRLCIYIAAFGDRSTCRISLGNKDARFLNHAVFIFVFGQIIVEMHPAIAQFFVVQVYLFGTFAGQFGYACNGFTLFLRILNFLQHRRRSIRISVQIIVQFAFQKIADKFTH